jgi:putative tRNA adenosine deaminase-associated protein
MDDAGVDFVVALWRDEGEWSTIALANESGDSLEALEAALRRLPAPTGAVGFVSVADEFLLVARVVGERTRLLLTDMSSAHDWPLAGQVLERLGVPKPEDVDDVVPVGDLTLLNDLGVHADDLDMILDDIDLYPDEIVIAIADRIGLANTIEELLGAIPS